jgi:hypothetical protein
LDVHLQILEMLVFDPSSIVNTLCQLVIVGPVDWTGVFSNGVTKTRSLHCRYGSEDIHFESVSLNAKDGTCPKIFRTIIFDIGFSPRMKMALHAWKSSKKPCVIVLLNNEKGFQTWCLIFGHGQLRNFFRSVLHKVSARRLAEKGVHFRSPGIHRDGGFQKRQDPHFMDG